MFNGCRILKHYFQVIYSLINMLLTSTQCLYPDQSKYRHHSDQLTKIKQPVTSKHLIGKTQQRADKTRWGTWSKNWHFQSCWRQFCGSLVWAVPKSLIIPILTSFYDNVNRIGMGRRAPDGSWRWCIQGRLQYLVFAAMWGCTMQILLKEKAWLAWI